MSEDPEIEWLPEFPVDNDMLDRIEHALGGSYEVDEDGTHRLIGADYTLTQLLDFMAGYDETLLIPLEGHEGSMEWYQYPFPLYHEHDVIRALISEVRRLRGEG